MQEHGNRGKVESKTNRLKNESSPYLLQHANNPVDWYAWGKSLFKERRKKTNLYFLA